MKLLQQIKISKPHFADEILEELTDSMINVAKSFANIEYWNSSDSINVYEVVDTIHPDYCNKSWSNLIEYGKRMSINLELLEKNPNYYFESRKKEPNIFIIDIDGKKYIHHDGNHRVCIAKFFFHYEQKSILHGINISRFQTDHIFKKAYTLLSERIQELSAPIILKVNKKLFKRDDNSGWKKDYYTLHLNIKNLLTRVEINADTEVINEVIKESYKPFKTIFSKYKIWKK